MSLEQYMGGKVSPMDTGKKDAEGNPVMDLTPEQAKEANAKAAQESLKKSLEQDAGKKPGDIRKEINEILKSL